MGDKKSGGRNWFPRLEEDRGKIDRQAKFELLKANLICVAELSPEEANLFLTPRESLENLDAITAYSVIERKVAQAYSIGFSPEWRNEEDKGIYIESFRNALTRFYTSKELEELTGLILNLIDVSVLTASLAQDHYGMRRIRNAYLPEITDLISIGFETEKGTDLTQALFAEGSEDAVSRIERVLRLERES